MPELPEVETIVRKLNQYTKGKRIQKLEVLRQSIFRGNISTIVGQKIKNVTRRAKLINIELDNGSHLLTHLKMTGQYVFQNGKTRVGGGHPTSDWVKDLPSKHTRLIFHLEGNSKLFFNDMRMFGWIRQHNKDELSKIFGKLGPDITSSEVTTKYLTEKLKNRRLPIKQAIMMNEIICGVGNIYASDSLNKAKISPIRPANSLTKREISKLIKIMKEIIDLATKLGGTTFDGMYVGVEGFAGGYQNKLLVYGREGESCYNCGGLIQKIKLGGRGTYYCPDCQN